MKIAAIVPVAGRGKRFASQDPKQYLEIDGKPIILITLQKILSINSIESVVIVVAPDEIERMRKIVRKITGAINKCKLVPGGKERQDSVGNGLEHVSDQTDLIIVHDGVRPLVSESLLVKTIETARQAGACVAATPVKDTIKRAHNDKIIETLSRTELWQVQTPQAFKYKILNEAHRLAKLQNYYATDEAGLVEWAGYPVFIVQGAYENLKITTADDLELAKALYKRVQVT